MPGGDHAVGTAWPLDDAGGSRTAAWRPLLQRLRTALPTLSDKVLSDRLAQLAETGVVERDRRPGWPPRVRYALTPRGHRLGPVLQALWDWGAEAPARGSGTGSGHETSPVH
ncbi:winged helix-turn-helix transcriptional regulator [Streptomyces sp. NPDC012589]|uniref:winged helix-turn-helix transcriptional regulator n=1 Tax=Streptomyces sp. NPDC012589 TaxID=3364839 RepID=UPI0036BDA8A7